MASKKSNLKCWKKIKDNKTSTIFRNVKDDTLTVEIHKFDKRTANEIGSKYYAFPAKNGKGIPNSPELLEDKNESLLWAKSYMKDNNKC